MSTSQVLHQLYSLNTSSTNFSRDLYNLIRSDNEDHYLSSLTGDDLTRLVDFLDNALCSIPYSDNVFRQCLRKLRSICGAHTILPSSYVITGDLKRVGESPCAFGGFADVWQGDLDGKTVCIKALRVSLNDTRGLRKSFFKEAVVWKRLKHPNIVPFLGVTNDPLQFVSEWMPNGVLTDYVKKHPGANRISLLLDVAEGLNYLHTSYTMHGDLKGPNILIDEDGHACLADFGLASIAQGADSITATRLPGFTERWSAPEVLDDNGKLTREADIFSFGMVVLEVFTGEYPFSGLRSHSVIIKILDGERPAYPQGAEALGFVTPIWDMTVDCWRHDPAHRPITAAIVEFLRECYALYNTDPTLSKLTPWKSSGHTVDPSIYRVISPPPVENNISPTQSTMTSLGSTRSFSPPQEYVSPQARRQTFNILTCHPYGSHTSLDGSFSEESLAPSVPGSLKERGTNGRRKQPRSATPGLGEMQPILGEHGRHRSTSLPSHKGDSPTPPNASGFFNRLGNTNSKRNGRKQEKHPPVIGLDPYPKPSVIKGKWKGLAAAIRFMVFAKGTSTTEPDDE